MPQYKFQHTINTSRYLDQIEPIENKNDIQFLFQSGATPNDVGHWICIKYDYLMNKVEIYDSFNHNNIPAENVNAIEKLYPKINIFKDLIFKKVQFKQNNSSACGVYACAFAISLALNKDPSNINFHINLQTGKDESEFLRFHLLEIISEDKILEFPTQDSD